ncbi:hypothetical protein EGW08_023132 [Elysia chlorotica]|uniref:Endonuclease/exonuclease/phosphatase domain-containing protein n=1 Tax=Elysia chlorotica TaxID=188477 RepID=A0A433SJ80_ELYCH|nr:hypothetical protein EGW08_023132 [Elysia chlorotica]
MWGKEGMGMIGVARWKSHMTCDDDGVGAVIWLWHRQWEYYVHCLPRSKTNSLVPRLAARLPPVLDHSSARSALIAWEPVSPRILTARFNSKGRKVTIIQCYSPTNAAKEEEKEEFYEQVQATFNKAPRQDMKIVMDDINAKVGTENAGKELIMGKQGVGTRNENGELFVEFCSFNDLAINGTIFPHKTIHNITWTYPDGRTQNQINHITIGRKWRRSLQDVRAKRGADAASDHQLVIAVLKLKLKAYRDQANRPAHKFNVQYLKNKAKASGDPEA